MFSTHPKPFPVFLFYGRLSAVQNCTCSVYSRDYIHHQGCQILRLAHGSESEEIKIRGSILLIKKHLFTYLFYIIYLSYMYTNAMEHVWRLEGNWWESALSFPRGCWESDSGPQSWQETELSHQS